MSGRLPRIVVKPPQHEVIAEMTESLRGSTDLYKRAGGIVRVSSFEGDLPPGIERPPEAPLIRGVGEATLRSKLSALAHYWSLDRVLQDGTEIVKPCHPPMWGVAALMEEGNWPLPRLEGLVEAPVLLRSGKLLDQPGYDVYSGLYYRPPAGMRFLPVPEKPSADEVEAARGWLHEAVIDFPFEKPAHRSAWMAGVLSYPARWLYSGPTPLFLVDGNVRGAGKGKLINAAAQICMGRKPWTVQQTTDDKEEREMITAAAMAGEMMIMIDNISRPFGSAPLDSALAEAVWNPILKYKNESSRFVLYGQWWGNGSNVEFRKHSDTVRRTLKIRIESPMQNPEERDDFKRKEPAYGRWLRDNRPELVRAALTILRGFLAAGAPTAGLRRWGTFESWSEIVRGALVWAGEPDPYDVAAIHDQTADSGIEALGELLRGWQALCLEVKADSLTGQEALTELRGHIEQGKTSASYQNPHERLMNALAELAPPKNGRLPDPGALGYALRRGKQRVVDGLRLVAIPGRGHTTSWAVRAES